MGLKQSARRLMASIAAKLRDDRVFLFFLLGLALVHGMLYLVLVPPWQHYDEPGRFEHAWLIANRPGLPEPGDEDPGMRRELLASMVAHDFYEGVPGGAPPIVGGKLPDIGISQLRDQPAYYWLAALPLRLLKHTDIVVQLYAARAVSLGLYVLSIWLIWLTMGALVSSDHPLRRAVPLFIVLLPAFTDVMTMVGDDVGAVAAFSFFLWVAVRTIRDGLNIWRVLGLLGAAGFCLIMKPTVGLAFLLIPLIVLLAVVRKSLYLWAAILVLGAIGLLLVFSWGDAAFWERQTDQRAPTSQAISDALLGSRALAVAPGGYVRQYLPRESVLALQGQTVTVGAWVWSTAPTATMSLGLNDGLEAVRTSKTIGIVPNFHAITATVGAEAHYLAVRLSNASDSGEVSVYFDGVTLAAGNYSERGAPAYQDSSAEAGTWLGQTFSNLLRNGSAEVRWPRLRSWVGRVLPEVIGWMPSPGPLLNSILDWERTHWVYGREMQVFLETFWARFGWGHVGVAPIWYWISGILTSLGILGTISSFYSGAWRLWNQSLRRSLFFLAASGSLIWGGAWLRIHPLHGTDLFIPGSRYGFPAVVPVGLTIMGGLWYLCPKRFRKTMWGGLFGFLVLLVGVSLGRIVAFF